MDAQQLLALSNFKEFVSTETVDGIVYYNFNQLVEFVDGKVNQIHRNILAHQDMQDESKSYFSEWVVTMKFVMFILQQIKTKRADTLYQALLSEAKS